MNTSKLDKDAKRPTLRRFGTIRFANKQVDGIIPNGRKKRE